MYRYRQCMPRASKHLDDKWVKHCQQLHRRRLQEMRPDVDNKPPQRFKHLEQKLKKQQMEEERFSQIERDNYLLLDKMSYIMTHPQLLDEKYIGAPVQFGKSLNKDLRKRELTRITEENLRILRRIQHSEPVLNHMEWEEKARRDEVYLRNCAEYPLVLPSRQNLPRDSIRHTSSSSQNRSMQRKRVGADNENALETHQGFQPVSAATSDPVLPWPVRQRNGGDDRGTPPQDESKDGMFTHQPDRALLQSRGASREGRTTGKASPGPCGWHKGTTPMMHVEATPIYVCPTTTGKQSRHD